MSRRTTFTGRRIRDVLGTKIPSWRLHDPTDLTNYPDRLIEWITLRATIR